MEDFQSYRRSYHIKVCACFNGVSNGGVVCRPFSPGMTEECSVAIQTLYGGCFLFRCQLHFFRGMWGCTMKRFPFFCLDFVLPLWQNIFLQYIGWIFLLLLRMAALFSLWVGRIFLSLQLQVFSRFSLAFVELRRVEWAEFFLSLQL